MKKKRGVKGSDKEGIVFSIGSGNLENLLVCKQRVSLGDKHEITRKNLWGGSAVNISSRLLAASLPVIPILAVGKDAAGSIICEALYKNAVTGGASARILDYLKKEKCLIPGVETPTSTILVHGRERSIFRPKLQTGKGFNQRFKNKIKKAMGEYVRRPISVILGHIPTDGIGTRHPGECTRFILNRLPKDVLVYGVFGSSQLALSFKPWSRQLDRIDIFQCNMEEAMRFFSQNNRKVSLRAIFGLLREKKMTAVLTMDRFGAIAVYKGRDYISVAWPLIPGDEVVDSTGAGDAFAAGTVSYLHNLNKGRDFTAENFEKALHHGSIWAAAACTTLGGCGEDPKKELSEFLKRHKNVAKISTERKKLATAQEFMNFIDLAYQ